MRVTKPPIDTRTLPWEPMNDVLRYRLLNGDLNSGPYTMILQSDIRTAQERKGQYHPADEEFYCLAGDFTFDGSTWFKEGSYAFYPAYFVHGARVHVRGGYEVYLRIGGTNDVFWEEDPSSDAPYPKPEAKLPDYAMQLTDAGNAQTPIFSPVEGVKAQPLHVQERTGYASTFLHVEAGADFSLASEGLLEIFTIAGRFEQPHHGVLEGRGYMCVAEAAASANLSCREAGALLVSHGADLIVAR